MIVVTDTSDSGAGTLRQAIADAAVGEEIQFAVGGTIDLQSELSIVQDVIITGPGSGALTIDRDGGAGNLRLLNISSGTVHITGLTFDDGDPGAGNGGAILIGATATVTIEDCVIQNSTTTGSGGGIYNSQVMTLNRCTIGSCSANGAGGGLFNEDTGTVSDCIFTGNTSNTAGGAIANTGQLDMTSCTVGNLASPNRALITGFAGGLWNDNTATIVDCNFDYNSGALTCSNIHNATTLYMLRGRITNSPGTLRAFVNADTASLEDVAITDNTGIAVYNDTGSIYFARVTISNNPLNPLTIGLSNNAGSCFVDTCTISGHTATGFSNDNFGSVDLRHSTITKNESGFIGSSGCFQTFENNIISGNTTSDINVDDADTDSLGHNIYGVMSNPITLGPGDMVVVGFANLRLGLLANNGGSTLTHALLIGSPAINTGNTLGGLPNNGWTFPDPRFQDYTAVPPTYDQRMFPRVDGGVIDIGAFEFVNPPVPPTPLPPVAQLISEANCLTCFGLKIEDALELVLLTNIVNRLDPTMDTSPQTLLNQGQCFACLGMDTGSVLKLVLLTLIYNLLQGGAGAPQCILCGTTDPVNDPTPCDCAWYINLTNSQTWYWDDPNNQWFQFG